MTVELDLINIKDKTKPYTDMSFEYYNSKYQFSDFKNYKVWGDDFQKIKKPFLLELKNGEYYEHSKQGIELAFNHLISIYQDLDKNFDRLKANYNDPMFNRFVCKLGCFTSEKMWEVLMRNWYKGFTFALTRYYNKAHQNFSFDSISYVAYFDMFFSNYLYYGVTRSDQHLKEDFKIDLRFNEYLRIDQNYQDKYLI